MTRKDYVAIAEALRVSRVASVKSEKVPTSWYDGANNQWRVSCIHIADMLAANNPRFDRQRFYDACGELK